VIFARLSLLCGMPRALRVAEASPFAILHAVTWSGRVSRLSSARRGLGGAALALLLGLPIAVACSGRSRVLDGPLGASEGDAGENQTGSGGSTASGGSGAGRGGTSSQAGSAGRGGSAGTRDGGEDPYVDPGCPDAEAPSGIVECDPFTVPSGCPEGLACKPNIVHPYGDGCDQQTFNLLCRPAGSGVQGSACGSASDCADGFICVFGAGAGTICLRMCGLDGTGVCPAGYVCGETDAQGIGVCA
jgi:hypothetical protein